jgi:hypothetical protein
MGTYVPPTFPKSVASFTSNTFDFDPLVAGETISISAQLSSGQGVLQRGQVLCGWAPGTARNVALSTTGSACAILAQDIDTGTAGAVTALVYVQGKFLVTAMIASGNGMELDSAELWNVGVYVMTVEQRSGLLVPWRSFPATPGVPLPQQLPLAAAKEAIKDGVDAIRAADSARPFQGDTIPGTPTAGGLRTAWDVAAFGESEPTPLQKAREDAAAQGSELSEAQRAEMAELTARQAKEAGDLARKQQEERANYLAHTRESLDAAKEPPKPRDYPPTPVPPPPPPPQDYR